MDDLVVSGWSAMSPFGLGAEPFAAGLRAGRPVLRDLDQATWPGPFDQAGLIPGFDLAAVLGKGTRAMDRATGIAVATVGSLVGRTGPGLSDRPQGTGLVLGTTSGSVQSIMDFTVESLVGEKPFYVDPARFPNTVMNRAAGQSAIWYQLKGPNTTIAGGALTGLLALNYAARLHRQRRAEVLLVGAVEEFSVHRAWLEWHSQDVTDREPLGEGGAVFVLEHGDNARRHGRTPLVTLLGSRFLAFHEVDDVAPALSRCVTELLHQAGAATADVALVAAAEPPGALGAQEAKALAAVGADRVGCRQLIGDTAAASAAFQLAAVISTAAGRADLAGRLALVTSVDANGMVGATLLRIPTTTEGTPLP